jgi:type VI secretion system protein ImpC
MEFEFRTKPSSRPASRSTVDAAFRIVVLADFSGRSNRGLREPLAAHRLKPVDSDNAQGVFGRLGASLNLPLACAPGRQAAIGFESLDDFHPDRLLQRVAPLAELLAALQMLKTPSTAAAGVQELQRQLGVAAVSSPSPAPASATPESAEDTLARLLGAKPTAASPHRPQATAVPDVAALIKNLVGGTSSAPPPPAGLAGWESATELELSARLRAVLHHPDLQGLEAAWRGVDFLLRRCPDEERVKFWVLDASSEELAADLSGLERLLRDQPGSVLVGSYTFGRAKADVDLLASLARLCASWNSTFLAGAAPQLAGCDSFAQHPDPDDWKSPPPADVVEASSALRAAPEAAHVGLALPRFILRQPYGAASDAIESFAFEELPPPFEHEAFLWGNGAFLCAQVLAEAALAENDATLDSLPAQVEGLPVCQIREDNEPDTKPCAEAWLTERAMQRLVTAGLIPVQSCKGRDAVRLPILQSLAGKSF